MRRIFLTIDYIYYKKNYITTAAENSNDEMFSCYIATLCFCGGKKIQLLLFFERRAACNGQQYPLPDPGAS